jgi:predicted AAA+ superfamily ATPase
VHEAVVAAVVDTEVDTDVVDRAVIVARCVEEDEVAPLGASHHTAGLRPVGKTTLLRHLAGVHGVRIVDLDDLATRDAVASDPALFVSGPGPVCIDEYQHVPQLLDAIQAELNRDARPGRFVITGSTRHDALPATAHSPTGRLHRMTVYPFSQGAITATRLSVSKLTRPDATSLRQFGHLLETFVVLEILKQASWLEGIAGTGHWRTHDGIEVDLVLEFDDGRILAIEVKAGTRIGRRDLNGLRTLRDELGSRFVAGVALHTGQCSYSPEDRIYVLPVDHLWAP